MSKKELEQSLRYKLYIQEKENSVTLKHIEKRIEELNNSHKELAGKFQNKLQNKEKYLWAKINAMPSKELFEKFQKHV